VSAVGATGTIDIRPDSPGVFVDNLRNPVLRWLGRRPVPIRNFAARIEMKRNPLAQMHAAAGPALAAVLALAAARAVWAAEPPKPLWPLEGRPAVSSNFCEYREGHLHAGLDIRTYGSDGAPEGYGKALYIRLDSGETLVYAHLAELDTTLERALYEAQVRSGRYSVDIRFPRGRFPVHRGDIVAWSGSTGGVDPHLHFEIRDGGENPLNPLSNGFALEDRLAPEFERIEFTPLDPEARINGHCWPVELEPVRLGEGRFAVRDTLVLSGGVGVVAEVFDRLNGRSGRLAPYRLTLVVDDTTVADVRLERFSFSHADQVDFLYDISRVRRERTYALQLFDVDGDSMWNRTFLGGGLLGNDPGSAGRGGGAGGSEVRRCVVVARDPAGNAARLEFQFRTGGSRPLGRAEWLDAPVRRESVVPGMFFRDGFVSTIHALAGVGLENGETLSSDRAASASIDGYRHPNVYTAQELLDGPIEVPARVADAPAAVYLIGVERGRPTSVSFSELGLQLVFGKNTLYTDAVVYAAAWKGNRSATDTGELVPRTTPVLIGPYSTTLRADMEVRFSTGPFGKNSAIYRLNEHRGEWVFYESATEEGSVRTTARRPGVYAVFDDAHGPRIRRPFVRTSRSYATGRKRPEIVVPIEDTGSGVDYRKTAVSLDGIEQIAYWDSRAKKLLVVVKDPNIMGPHAISVVAYDNIGNRSQLDASVDIKVTSHPRKRG
jgi:hypothetical protein